ncbi:hypothetical protein HOLleu_23632 [Holothuria leucospilota]|uniref:Uncharacterized protein n=1 Tax=Holothuria leucospilota TaxID=206669 RepID=A0A9Q1H313_HOLLE|nr:hypothetical protein HOLleu_23632 [Holothuria leucospilota]
MLHGFWSKVNTIRLVQSFLQHDRAFLFLELSRRSLSKIFLVSSSSKLIFSTILRCLPFQPSVVVIFDLIE